MLLGRWPVGSQCNPFPGRCPGLRNWLALWAEEPEAVTIRVFAIRRGGRWQEWNAMIVEDIVNQFKKYGSSSPRARFVRLGLCQPLKIH